MMRLLHRPGDAIFGPNYEPTTLAMIAIAASVAGAGVSAYGSAQSGKAQKKAADFQAGVLKQQAEQERQNAEGREQDFRKAQSRAMATRRAIMGASGVEMGEGSPLAVTSDMETETELQALRIRAGGDIAANRLEQDATLQGMAGKNALTEGYTRAGGSLLSGAGQAFGQGALLKAGVYGKTA